MDIASLVGTKPKVDITQIRPGDTIKVSAKVVEGERQHTQVFQGTVIKVHNAGANSNFTVRRVTYGVGVERTFQVNSPLVEKVEVVRHGKVRRAKLFYLRGRSTKLSRLKEKREKEASAPESVPEPAPEQKQQPQQ